MATMRVTGGALEVETAGEPPGVWGGAPPSVGYPLPEPPEPPPGLWPPPSGHFPITPLPPDYPMPPGSIWPPVHPPVVGGGPIVRPPVVGGGPIPPPVGVPPGPPGMPPGVGGGPVLPPVGVPPGPPGLPGHLPISQKFLVAIVAARPGGGLQVIGYTVVDPSLDTGLPLPGGPPGHATGQPVPPPKPEGPPAAPR